MDTVKIIYFRRKAMFVIKVFWNILLFALQYSLLSITPFRRLLS